MTLWLKAWHFYIIGVFLVGFPATILLVNSEYSSGKGIAYDMASMFVTAVIVGGFILVIYYAVKSSRTKKNRGHGV